MSLLVLLGGAAGLGLFVITAGLWPKRPRLGDLIAVYDETTTPPLVAESSGGGPLLARLGRLLGTAAARIGHPLSPAEDLAMLRRDEADQLSLSALAALGGAAAGTFMVVVFHRLLPSPGAVLTVLLPLAGALVGTLLAARSLQKKASSARESFLRGFGCWLELVALAQAGGMGIEGALRASYSVSSDPTFTRLAETLEQTRFGALTPWQALDHLGEEIGVPALLELGATLGLAGMEGARVRSSLLAKSDSLRKRAISEAEAKANATTERLFLPSIVMMLAFLVFLMYPAGVHLAGVL